MPIYTFRCGAGHASDVLSGVGVSSRPCPECGATAGRVSVYATQIGGRARTPVAERRVSLREYREASEQIAYEHEKAEESAQRPLPQPNLWAKAKANVEKLERAGITDSLDYDPRYVK